ncbi:MAG TPA: nucleotide exchange factor GrpE [bacterium]|nr:nucleotide exchange factor GrpE [bacterium]
MDNKKLKKELEECKKQKDEYLAGWQRSKADFLNYKKEEMERISELLKYANEELILKILPILDNFNLATKEKNVLKNDQIIQGFLQIKIQLENLLKSYGIEEIRTIREKFDPSIHEIVEQVEKRGRESGIITEEIQKGYKLNNKVIRPAKVKVIK